MICKYCNTENQDNAIFCGNCGKKVTAGKNHKRSKRVLLLLSGFFSFLLLLVVGNLIYLLSAEHMPIETPALSQNIVSGENTEKNSLEGERLQTVTLLEDYITLSKGQYKKIKLKEQLVQDIVWESDTENLVVDNMGVVFAKKSDCKGMIMMKDKDSDTVLAKCRVNVLSERDGFIKAVSWLNEWDYQMEEIDLFSESFTLGEKNRELSWDGSLFYTLEDTDEDSDEDGRIKDYSIEKKRLVNKETKNLIEFEIYSHPNTDEVQKIVSIEYKENLLEITDYYYDKGKINFIFKREEAVYTPTYATTKKTGDRFFFSDDRMTTWRQVNKPDKLKDYIAHAPKETKKVEGVKKTERYYTLSEEESSQFGKKQMNQEKQMEFDAMEIRMLNEAYQVYQVVLEAENVAFISGYVVDVNGNPIPGASVRVFSTEYEVFVGEALTDESGKYQIAALASTSGYDLFISKEGMIEVKVYDVSISEQSLALYQETVYLIPLSSAGDYSLTLLLYDSINKNTEITENFYENEYGGENPYLGNSMMPLAYANLNIREGMNNRNGTIIRSDKADAYGYVAIRLPAGIYTGEIRKDGYINSYFTIISKRNGDYITSNSSPILGEDEIRIVLTWGSNPSDLDSHLFTPYQGSGGDMQHIGFNRRVDDHGNNLDVDDRSSYGPETITINKLGGGSYKYFVVDYSNCSSRDLKSLEMSYSNARVDVYTKDGLQQVFFVPRQQRGVIWEVFEIKNKQVIPINRYYNNTDDKDWWQEDRGVYSSEEIGGK